MDVDVLVRLAGVLCADARLAGEVRLAAEDPQAYWATFRKGRYSLLGGPGPDLPWIALVDGLVRRRRVLDLDWKDDLELIREGFGTVRPRPPARVWRALVAAEDESPGPDVLSALARALVGTGLVLARFDDDGDMFHVLLLTDAELPEVVRLAQESGYGTMSAWSTEEPEWEWEEVPEREAPRTWLPYLAWLGHYGTDGFLLDVVRDPGLLDPARDALSTAPPKDQRLVEAVGVLLRRDPVDAVAAIADVDVVLDAVLHLHYAEDRAGQVFAIVLAALDRFGLPDKRIARTRAIVQAVRFRNKADRARPAFLALAPEQRDRLRAIVHRQLVSQDAASVSAALQAACVVGNRETLALVKAVAEPANEVRVTASFLRRSPGDIT